MYPSKIELPPALRQRLDAELTRIKSALATESNANGTLQAEISNLEQTRLELAQQIAALNVAVITDEAAAGQLVNGERRRVAITARLDQLKSQPAPRIDIGETYGVLFAVVMFYQKTLRAAFVEHLAEWGFDTSAARLIIDRAPVFEVLASVQNWLGNAPAPTANNIARMIALLDRAASGQVNLAADAAPAEPAPAQTPPESPSETATTTAKP